MTNHNMRYLRAVERSEIQVVDGLAAVPNPAVNEMKRIICRPLGVYNYIVCVFSFFFSLQCDNVFVYLTFNDEKMNSNENARNKHCQ